MIGKAALDRGYSVLMYEGPGQGEPLRKYGMTFTPEWEKPNAAVLDEFLRSHDKPPKIVLFGMSMGGYLAPRAAAFEDRIDGVVAYDVRFDLSCRDRGRTVRRTAVRFGQIAPHSEGKILLPRQPLRCLLADYPPPAA